MKKSLLLLDLDETLGHTFRSLDDLHKLNILNRAEYQHILSECYFLDFFDSHKKRQEHMWGKKRPYVDTFLKYAFENYDYVGVWTAATEDYAQKFIDVVFKTNKPHFVFDRRDCLEFIDENGYKDLTKPLKMLFDKYTHLSEVVDINKVDMIDNKENNFLYNRNHGLVIEDYAPVPTLQGLAADDKYLLAAIIHLNKRILKPEIITTKKSWLSDYFDELVKTTGIIGSS